MQPEQITSTTLNVTNNSYEEKKKVVIRDEMFMKTVKLFQLFHA